MYRIAVCDDEEAVRAQIIRVLSAHPRRDSFSVVEFSSGEALLESLRAGQTYLLLILDIQLQEQNGVTVGRLLREELKDNTTQLLYVGFNTQRGLCRDIQVRKGIAQAINREDMERWAALFQPPDAGELRGEYGPG